MQLDDVDFLARSLANPRLFAVPTNLGTYTIGDLCRRYAETLAVLDKLEDATKEFEAVKSAMRQEFINRARVEGVEKFSGAGVTVTIKDKLVEKYDPQRWDEILKELVERGHGYCVHRRISVSKLQELMDAGERLPAGLTIETIKEVSHKRVRA